MFNFKIKRLILEIYIFFYKFTKMKHCTKTEEKKIFNTYVKLYLKNMLFYDC